MKVTAEEQLILVVVVALACLIALVVKRDRVPLERNIRSGIYPDAVSEETGEVLGISD